MAASLRVLALTPWATLFSNSKLSITSLMIWDVRHMQSYLIKALFYSKSKNQVWSLKVVSDCYTERQWQTSFCLHPSSKCFQTFHFLPMNKLPSFTMWLTRKTISLPWIFLQTPHRIPEWRHRTKQDLFSCLFGFLQMLVELLQCASHWRVNINSTKVVSAFQRETDIK